MRRLSRLTCASLFFFLGLSGAFDRSVRGEDKRVDAPAEAKFILRPVHLPSGLVIHLNSGDGELTVELSQGGKFLVQGLEADPATVEKARRTIEQRKLSGKVSVLPWSEPRLPYVSNLVNVLVAEDLGKVPEKEVLRVLRPHGIARIKRQGAWTTLTKPWPKEMDEWTHLRYGPGNNAASRDTTLAPPLRLQWQEGPLWPRGPYLHYVQGAVSAGGRLFYVHDEAPTGLGGPDQLVLVARDAFNGLFLWKRPVNRNFEPDTLVAFGDRVYLPLEGQVKALDAATGETVCTYTTPYKDVRKLLYLDGTLLVASPRGVCALGAEKGEMRWKQDVVKLQRVVAGDGRVFCQDNGNRKLTWVCFDLADGKQRWRQGLDLDNVPSVLSANLVFYHQGVLVMSREIIPPGDRSEVRGFAAESGKPLWSYKFSVANRRAANSVLYADGLVWVNHDPIDEKKRVRQVWKGLDPQTGQLKKSIEYPYQYGVTHRCFPDCGTGRFLISGRMGFADLTEHDFHFAAIFKGVCGIGTIPANGMLYTFPHECQCYPMHRGLLGLASRSEEERFPVPVADSGRLEKGPAFGSTTPAKKAPAPQDWSTWRHDVRRSGSTTAVVPSTLRQRWSAELPGTPSAPVAAEGAVLVAARNTHQVIALNAEDGTRRWRFTAGGRIDTPPTVHEGLALFGCRDGWVYCLRLRDGALVWRFRAAPAEQLIMVEGQLESSWPVSGTILIADGMAFFSVGRVTDPKDGPCLYGLEPHSGKIVREETSRSPVLCDVLSSDELSIYLGNLALPLSQKPADVWKGYLRPFSMERAGNSHSQLDGTWQGSRRDLSDDRGVVAQRLVFNRDRSYGVIVGSYAPGKTRIAARAKPGMKEYQLFAADPASKNAVWTLQLPLRVSAMLATEQVLFVGGPPDSLDPKGGGLWVFSVKDGKKLSEYELSAPPVDDGLAATPGRVYVCTEDGKILCLCEK